MLTTDICFLFSFSFKMKLEVQRKKERKKVCPAYLDVIFVNIVEETAYSVVVLRVVQQ